MKSGTPHHLGVNREHSEPDAVQAVPVPGRRSLPDSGAEAWVKRPSVLQACTFPRATPNRGCCLTGGARLRDLVHPARGTASQEAHKFREPVVVLETAQEQGLLRAPSLAFTPKLTGEPEKRGYTLSESKQTGPDRVPPDPPVCSLKREQTGCLESDRQAQTGQVVDEQNEPARDDELEAFTHRVEREAGRE